MLRPLANVRQRVERLATQVGSGLCKGDHQRLRIVHTWNDDPTPPWPEKEKGERCACGAELEYVTIVHQYTARPEPSMGPGVLSGGPRLA